MTVWNRRQTWESSRCRSVDGRRVSESSSAPSPTTTPTCHQNDKTKATPLVLLPAQPATKSSARTLAAASSLSGQWWLLLRKKNCRTVLAALAFLWLLMIAAFVWLDHRHHGTAGIDSTSVGVSPPGLRRDLGGGGGVVVVPTAAAAGAAHEEKHEPSSSVDGGGMVILVLSAASNGKRRDAIRETWGRSGFSPGARRHDDDNNDDAQHYIVRFVVGIDSAAAAAVGAAAVEAESKRHGDVLMVPVIETYENLPRKLYEALRWAVQQEDYPTKFQWFVKADDDMFLRPALLYESLVATFNAHAPVVVGRILRDEPVHHYGKWDERTYAWPIYPPFPQGSCGYVLSRPVAAFIARRQATTDTNGAGGGWTYYHGEDTSLGIWLSTWHDDNDSEDATATDHGDENNNSKNKNNNKTAATKEIRWIDAPVHFVNSGQCDDKNASALIVGHKITPEHIKQCFAADLSRFSAAAAAAADEDMPRKIPITSSSVVVGSSSSIDRQKKIDSAEYQAAMARYEQRQRVTAREEEDEARRTARERRRQEQQQQQQSLGQNHHQGIT